MNYKSCKLLLLAFLCFWFAGCLKNQPKIQSVIVVKIPPYPKENWSREEYYWHFQKFLFPQDEIPNPIPKVLPNDDSLLIVSLEKDGKLKLNSENKGEISDTKLLVKRLAEIFRERREMGVYEPGNWEIVKAVAVKAPRSAKYGDVVKVIDAVKESGAEPLVLLVDGLPE
jgi:biopolymer transport protein ExbD